MPGSELKKCLLALDTGVSIQVVCFFGDLENSRQVGREPGTANAVKIKC